MMRERERERVSGGGGGCDRNLSKLVEVVRDEWRGDTVVEGLLDVMA